MATHTITVTNSYEPDFGGFWVTAFSPSSKTVEASDTVVFVHGNEGGAQSVNLSFSGSGVWSNTNPATLNVGGSVSKGASASSPDNGQGTVSAQGRDTFTLTVLQKLPDSPTSCSASVNGDSITVNWSAVTGATGYVLKIKYNTADYVGNYADSGTGNTKYWASLGDATRSYRVYAVNSKGQSSGYAQSNQIQLDSSANSIAGTAWRDDNAVRSEYYHRSVTVSGMSYNKKASFSSNTNGAQFSLNQSSWSTSLSNVAQGDTAYIRFQASNIYDDERSVTIRQVDDAGTQTARSWYVTTEKDRVADQFYFSDNLIGVELDTDYEDSVTVSGLGSGVSVNVSTGTSSSYKINSGPYVTGLNPVVNDDVVTLKIRSSINNNTYKSGTIAYGNKIGSWGITTRDVEDSSAEDFFFDSPETNAIPNDYYTSSVIVAGLGSGVSVIASVNGTGATFKVGSGSYTSSNKNVYNGNTVTLRIQASPDFNTQRNASLSYGGQSDSWSVKTKFPSTNPNSFSIGPNLTGQNLGEVFESAPITISGIDVQVTVGSLNGSHKIGSGGSWTSENQLTHNVSNGSVVYFRMTSSYDQDDPKTGSLTIGDGPNDYASRTIRTKALDADPADFFLGADVSNHPVGQLAYSNSPTITGMDVGANAYATISSYGEFRINGQGIWYNSSSYAQGINTDDTVQVRIQASSTYGAYKSATLYIGNQNDTWGVRATYGTDADNFSFGSDQNNAQLGQPYTNFVTVSGLGTNVSVPATLSGNGTFKVNSGTYSSASKNVTNGDKVTLKIVASNSYDTRIASSIAYGGQSSSWGVRSRLDTDANSISFGGYRYEATRGQPYTSSDVVSGLGANVSVTATCSAGCTFKVGSGSYTSSANVKNGDTVTIKIVASPNYSTTLVESVNWGGQYGYWGVDTEDAPDTTLDSLNFGSNVTDAYKSEQVIRPDMMTGINKPVTMTASDDGWLSTDNSNYSKSLQVVNGSELFLKIEASSSYEGFRESTVTGGGRSAYLSVKVIPDPNPTTYTDFPFTNPEVFGLADVKAFFGNTGNKMSDYYKGGLYVEDIPKNSGIPNSSQRGLKLTDFYGSGKSN